MTVKRRAVYAKLVGWLEKASHVKVIAYRRGSSEAYSSSPDTFTAYKRPNESNWSYVSPPRGEQWGAGLTDYVLAGRIMTWCERNPTKEVRIGYHLGDSGYKKIGLLKFNWTDDMPKERTPKKRAAVKVNPSDSSSKKSKRIKPLHPERMGAVKKAVSEKRAKVGHVSQLGTFKQSGTGEVNKSADAKRSAMRAGYRVSKSGNLYFERRANRSDTPLERRDFNLMLSKRSRGTTRTSRGLGRAHQHDKYKASPKLRPAKLIRVDNCLTKIVVGHWFNFGWEFCLMQMNNPDDEGLKNVWFIWNRKLPNKEDFIVEEGADSKWAVWNSTAKTNFNEALKVAEEYLHPVKISTPYVQKRRESLDDVEGFKNLVFNMTEGLYKFIDTCHKSNKHKFPNMFEFEKMMRPYEKKISNLDHEEILCFDGSGNVLYHGIGIDGSCYPPEYVMNICLAFTHNHPNQDYFKYPVFSGGRGDVHCYHYHSSNSHLMLMHAVSGKMYASIHGEIPSTKLNAMCKIIDANYCRAFDAAVGMKVIHDLIDKGKNEKGKRYIDIEYNKFMCVQIHKKLIKDYYDYYHAGEL